MAYQTPQIRENPHQEMTNTYYKINYYKLFPGFVRTCVVFAYDSRDVQMHCKQLH